MSLLLLFQTSGAAPQTITVAGISQGVGFGSPKLNQHVSVSGISQGAGFGTHKLNQTFTVTGISQPVELGTPTLGGETESQTITPEGIGQDVEFGNPALSSPAAYVPVLASGGRWQPIWIQPARQTIAMRGLAVRMVCGQPSLRQRPANHNLRDRDVALVLALLEL